MESIVAPYHRGLRLGSTDYGTSWGQIVGTVVSQIRAAGPTIQAMIEVRDRHNAEWVLPGFEDFGDLSPLVIADTIDNLGMAAGQVDPSVYVPALDDRKLTGVSSVEYANIRRRMIEATMYHSAFDVGRGRSYRHLTGYATFSIQVKPDFEQEHMRWVVRDPLTTYCEPKDPEDLTLPRWIAFVGGMSGTALRKQYPQVCKEYGGFIPKTPSYQAGDTIYDVIEWHDGDCMVIGVLGPRSVIQGTRSVDSISGEGCEIYRVPNRVGLVGAVAPSQVTFDKIMSAVMRVVGHSDLMAKFTALDLMQSEKSVVPDRYIIGRDGMTPRLVAGRWIDGREGETNYVVDATAVGELRGTPDPSGKIAHDRIEGEAKRHAGLAPQMQGETYGALRTGRGIDSLYATAVDPRIAEMHRIMGHALSELSKATLAGYKKLWGTKNFSMFTGATGDSVVRFQPDKHVEVLEPEEVDHEEGIDRPEKLAVDNIVAYPIPGTDVLNLTMAVGQIRAMGLMPVSMLRRLHPWTARVADQAERGMIVEEFEGLVKASLAQRMAPGGGIPPADQVQILKVLRDTGDIEQAIAKADELAAARQAAEAPPAGEGAAVAAELMPGLGLEGEGREMQEPAPAIAGPNDAQANLKSLSLALKQRPPANAPV